MAHLTGARTKREITSVEVVSDDSMQVLKFTVNENSMNIAMRDATESDWSAKTIATLDMEDAKIVATLLRGGTIESYGSLPKQIEAISAATHTLPTPEEKKGPMDGDCTPLDIERAKAENLREERENIKLQLGRDHAISGHNPDVPGCPSCETRVRPGYGDGTLRDDFRENDTNAELNAGLDPDVDSRADNEPPY